MYGLKKDSYRMRLKGSSVGQMGRTVDDTSGVCVVCGRYMEQLKDNRCFTEECDLLLAKLCADRGLKYSAVVDGDLITILNTGRFIEERRRFFADAESVTDQTDVHMCQCGRGFKLPRKELCAACYRAGNVDRLRGRKAKAKTSSPHITGNRIKGLDKLLK